MKNAKKLEKVDKSWKTWKNLKNEKNLEKTVTTRKTWKKLEKREKTWKTRKILKKKLKNLEKREKKLEKREKSWTVIKWGWEACATPTSRFRTLYLTYLGLLTNFASCIFVVGLVGRIFKWLLKWIESFHLKRRIFKLFSEVISIFSW